MARKPSYRELEQKINELERQLADGKPVSKKPPHLHSLESMERINKVIGETADLEQVMSGVLEVVLSILHCDRAWLIFPCDPDAPTWSVLMERTRPEFPGAFSLDKEIVTTPEMAEQFRAALESKAPIAFDPSSGTPLPDSARKFSTRSAIIMAIYPKTGKPWLWGLSQCSHPRIWTEEDSTLFSEISLRLTDAMSSLLFLKNLRESEEKYRLLVESAGEGIILTQEGKVRYVNPRVVESLGYSQEEILSHSMIKFVHPDDRERLARLYLLKVAGNEVPPVSPWRIIDRSGTVKWVQSRSTLLTWEGKLSLLTFLVDITQQKEAEEALRESEERWHFALEGAGDGVWDWNAQTNEVFFSRQWKAMLGYEDHEIGNTLDEWDKRVHPEDRDRVYVDINRHFSGETQSYMNEHRVRCKDGTYKWILDRGKVISWNPEGKPLRVIGTHTDISEQKRIQAELIDNRQLLNNILESSGVAIAYARDRKIIWANQAMVDLFGFTEEDGYAGKDTRILYATEEDYMRIGKLTYETPPVKVLETEAVFRRQDDGNEFYGHAKVNILDPSNPKKGIIVNIEDITGRRRAEEALRESEERYRTAIEYSNDGVAIVEGDKHIFVNQKFIEIFGYDRPEEVVGKSVSLYVHPDDKERVREINRKRQAGEPVFSKYEFKGVRKDGESVHIEVSATRTTYRGKSVSLVYLRDVTDRKRAEEELRRSENRFRFLAENSKDMIYRMTLHDGHYEYVSPASVEMTGYTPNEIYDSPMWIQKVIHPDWQEYLEEEWAKLLVGNMPPSYEYQIIHKSGDTRWLYQRNTLVRDDNGNPFAIEGVVTDITERKRAEEALQESEERYRNLVEGSFDGIFIHKGSKIIFANQRLYEMLAYNKGELEGMDHWLICHPDYRALTRERAEARTRGEDIPPQYEVRQLRKDGSSFDGEIHARRIMLGDEPGIQVWVRDITERKRAEEALRESESRFRTAFENAAVGMALVSLDGVYLEVNMAMARMIGYTQTELVGKPVARFTHPDELKRRYQFIDDLVSGRITSGEQERRWVHRDGSEVWTLIWATVQRDSEGRFLYFISLILDITERKKAEEEKRRLEAQFQHALKMEAIGTLAGGLAHDFNNILMGIQGRASLMLLDLSPSHPNYEHLKGIEDYVTSAADLTKQLLGFARGGKYEVKPTDLNELVDRCANLFGRTKKEITVHRKFQPDLWTVEVDRRQMDQVLLNLFVNAWQAMPAGGELYLQTENVVLDEGYVEPHDMKPGLYAKISVTDTGVGMDEETKQRLFDPFFTTKRMGRGTGLGLASAYGIIKHHGGIIGVYSEKGHGSTFNIYLPASGKAVLEEKEPTGDLLRGEGTILLVDDEEMILEVGKPMLERLGYEVLVARSGKEAIEVYQGNRGRIKMVILDMIMPEMSGGETFDQLKAIKPDVVVLLSSGYSINGQAQEILARGCDGFIQKPFSYGDLSRKLLEVLDGKVA